MALTGCVVLAVLSCACGGRRAAALLSKSPLSTLTADFGYAMQPHEVATEDGYLLIMHRLLRPNAGPWMTNGSQPHGTPVLLGHGLGSNSEQWLLRREQNLAFELVDHGFDVWLANFRGSLYGRRHTRLVTNSHKFWDFSWHENGVLDQAAMIDHVLATTGQASMLTVGFSMSCTTQLVLQAERPEYNDKVRAAVLLAPPAYFEHPAGLWRLTSALFKALPVIKTATKRYVVNDKMAFSDTPLGSICFSAKRSTPFTAVCKYLLEFFAGKPNAQISDKSLHSFLARYPAGASIRQLLHYGQGIMSGGSFRKYDYGEERNKRLYGSAKPPSYDLSAITSPIYFFYGSTDQSVNSEDAEHLARDLHSAKVIRKIEGYNHFDFLIDDDVDASVNKHVIGHFESHLNGPITDKNAAVK